jgi:hypothetical protein
MKEKEKREVKNMMDDEFFDFGEEEVQEVDDWIWNGW